MSPLLANIALSVLDEHFAQDWQTTMRTTMQRRWRRHKGQGTWRLVRFADDFVVMVAGSQAVAETLRGVVEAVLAPLGLRLAAAKTRVVHLDEGFDFLGFHIQRRRKRGCAKRYVYTYPSAKAVQAVRQKVRALTHRSSPLPPRVVLLRLNAELRGWCAYFQHGVSKRTFSKLDSFAWRRVTGWLRKRHKRLSWASLRQRFMPGWDLTVGGVTLFKPSKVPVTRYRYRGTRIPNLWGSGPHPVGVSG